MIMIKAKLYTILWVDFILSNEVEVFYIILSVREAPYNFSTSPTCGFAFGDAENVFSCGKS